MKIVIIGGTGRIGSKTCAILAMAGHQVIAAAPSMGVDAVTGEGLADAHWPARTWWWTPPTARPSRTMR
jgi:uncharacterized protein YbjT (DUF2867 family)